MSDDKNPSQSTTRSNYEVAELTWRYGQLAMHGLNGFLRTAPTKPACRSCDTLESIVDHATCHMPQLGPDHFGKHKACSHVIWQRKLWSTTEETGMVDVRFRSMEETHNKL
ncbi:hypothetical protein V6N13_117135 [Hibiscus sabdariffa]|uniref:Uncharacterized protein n=1 Tax=Hibiscus sabdariffa TaxID=183260 RepID=A0ABR2QHY8_9ROSI